MGVGGAKEHFWWALLTATLWLVEFYNIMGKVVFHHKFFY